MKKTFKRIAGWIVVFIPIYFFSVGIAALFHAIGILPYINVFLLAWMFLDLLGVLFILIFAFIRLVTYLFS